jgi:hypothetical protein
MKETKVSVGIEKPMVVRGKWFEVNNFNPVLTTGARQHYQYMYLYTLIYYI